jgi:hypothetical protein
MFTNYTNSRDKWSRRAVTGGATLRNKVTCLLSRIRNAECYEGKRVIFSAINNTIKNKASE